MQATFSTTMTCGGCLSKVKPYLDNNPDIKNWEAVIMAVGLVGVIAAVRKKQAIQCACLGTAFNLPMSVVTIIENSVMLVMALAMLVAAY